MKEYDVLFKVTDEKNNKKYVAYTDNIRDNKGKVKVYLSEEVNGKLIEVSHEEMKELEKIVDVVREEVCSNEN